MSLKSKYFKSKFLSEHIPLGVSAGLIGAAVFGGLTRDEMRTDKAIIAEQKEKINRLQDKIDGFAENEGAPCDCPTPKQGECLPKEATCADNPENREKLAAANQHTCLDGAKSVNIMAASRHNCAAAETIHSVIDNSKAACNDVIGSSDDQNMDDQNMIILAEDALYILEKSHKNPWINPPACRLK